MDDGAEKRMPWGRSDLKGFYLPPEHSLGFPSNCQLIFVFQIAACQMYWIWNRNFFASCHILSLFVIISVSFSLVICVFYTPTTEKQFRLSVVDRIFHSQMTCWKLNNYFFMVIFSSTQIMLFVDIVLTRWCTSRIELFCTLKQG